MTFIVLVHAMWYIYHIKAQMVYSNLWSLLHLARQRPILLPILRVYSVISRKTRLKYKTFCNKIKIFTNSFYFLVYSLQTSEDSLSQGTETVSELSDEAAPILGRRAIRENINLTSKYSDDSDSDLDLYRVSKSVLLHIFTYLTII